MGKLSLFEGALSSFLKKQGKKAIEHGGAPVSPASDKARIANDMVRKKRKWEADLAYIARQMKEPKDKLKERFRFERHPATLRRRHKELLKAIKASHESVALSDHQKRRMLQRAAAMEKLIGDK